MNELSESAVERMYWRLRRFVGKKLRRTKVEHVSEMSLQEYCALFSKADCPNDEQIEYFVQYVAGAHSWYKHLPLVPPGRPFLFFFDPFAGYSLQSDGSTSRYVEATEETGGHYNYLKTAEWRRRFGALSYRTMAVPELLVIKDGVIRKPPERVPEFSTKKRGKFRVPDEVVNAGRAELTAVVHDRLLYPTASYQWLARVLVHSPVEMVTSAVELDWPEELGGNAFRDEFARRARLTYELRKSTNPYERPRNDDRFGVLEMLLTMRNNERERMRKAINRVRDLIFPVVPHDF